MPGWRGCATNSLPWHERVVPVAAMMAGCVVQRLPLRRAAPVLAAGAWFRNTLCATAGAEAWLTPSVGDLRDVAACTAHEQLAQTLLAAMPEAPRAIACDLHPDFHSTQHAQRLAAQLGVPIFAVQHHHAHIAAVCAEQGYDGPVLGLAVDGVGLGTDGTAWGGELLHVEGARWRRLGHLRPLALPGGDKAALEPWRMAASALHALGRSDEIPARFPEQSAAAALAALLHSSGAQNARHCPPSSSLGRVFDAAAGLLGMCTVTQSDAEAACALEAAARRHGPAAAMAGAWRIGADLRLDLLPLLDWLAGRAGLAEKNADQAAAVFHATLSAALADWLIVAARQHDLEVVAVGGGCCCNRILLDALRGHCAVAGLRFLEPHILPPGDAAIAFGQAVIAQHLVENA